MVTAYLDFAENMTLRHIPLTMQDWEKRLNSFIEMFDYGILQDAGKVSAEITKLLILIDFKSRRLFCVLWYCLHSHLDKVANDSKIIREALTILF